MFLRVVSLFLFLCSAITLTGCQGGANPLGGVTRMIEAMGRSVTRLSADAKPESLRLDPAEIERAREAELQRGALPENAPVDPGSSQSTENRFASAR